MIKFTFYIFIFISVSISSIHYENLRIFSEVKIENFIGKIWIFLIILLKTLVVGSR